ncbi:MAG: hypothetical protein ACOCVZ_09050 [Gemmatimonadota bacterium]
MQARAESTANEGGGRFGIGSAGKLVVGGTVSTGLLLGGYIVAAMTLAGRMNANALILTSIALFLVGAVVGLLVSAAVALVGRDDGVTLKEGWRQVGKGALFAIPACLGGSVLAGWIAMAVIALYVGGIAPIALSVVAGLVGLLVMGATFKVTCGCCANLADRVRKRE